MRTVEQVLAIKTELDELFDTVKYPYENPKVRNLITILHNEDKVFKCNECGKMCCYGELEAWCCNFNDLDNGLICSICYETDMGDDL